MRHNQQITSVSVAMSTVACCLECMSRHAWQTDMLWHPLGGSLQVLLVSSAVSAVIDLCASAGTTIHYIPQHRRPTSADSDFAACMTKDNTKAP